MKGHTVRLQAYVLGRTALGVAAALGVVAAVVMLVDFVEISRTLGARADPAFIDLIELVLLKTPSVGLLLLPFVFLFGVMGAFVAMNRRGELIALRAAGVSAWQILAPASLGALLFGVLAVTTLNPLAARLNGVFETRRAILADGGAPGSAREIWLRETVDDGQVVIRARGVDHATGALRLTGVSIFVQPGVHGRLGGARRLEAREAVLSPGFWRLLDVREAEPGADSARSESLLLPTSLDTRSALERFASPGAVPFWDLPASIRSARSAGASPAGYALRWQQLLATPLLLAAMTVLSAAFSLRLFRLGDLARLAGAGVALGFAVFFLNQVCGALGVTRVIPIVLAAWAPPTLALLSGLTLLCYTEDG